MTCFNNWHCLEYGQRLKERMLLYEERGRDTHCNHEIVSPSASVERGQPPPPDRAAERMCEWEVDPHLCSCRLWQIHAGLSHCSAILPSSFCLLVAKFSLSG